MGFLDDGGRELARKLNRAGLRRRLAADDRDRAAALTRLGQTGWDATIDVSAYGAIGGQLAQLAARAGDLSAGSAKLEKERAEVEAKRQGEVSRFDAMHLEAKGAQTAAEAALRAANAAFAKETDAVAKGPLTEAVAARSAERDRLAAEAARIEAARAATLGPLDADLNRLREASTTAANERAAVGRDQAERYRELGAALYERRPPEVALAEGISVVAAIDERRSAKQTAIDASLGMTRVLPSGTMAKFWSVVVIAPVFMVSVGYGLSRWMGSDDVAGVVAGTAATGNAAPRAAGASSGAIPENVLAEESKKDAAVKAYRASPNDADRRREGLDVLYSDIMMLGSSADRTLLPMLITLLERGEPELRAGAAQAIGMIGPTAAEVPVLTKALYDPRRRVREGAASALGRVSDPAIGQLMRRVQAGAPNVQPKDDGLAPMATPDAGRIGVPVYPGATFLPFASDPGSGRHAFSTDASPQEVADFYANAASGRKAVGVEEFSRLYFRASADDPTGAKTVMADQGAWFKRVIESGRQPVEADMERQQQAMLNLPGLRYSDATLYGSPVFVASTLDSSGGVARATRYVAIFQDLGLGRTGIEIYQNDPQPTR